MKRGSYSSNIKSKHKKNKLELMEITDDIWYYIFDEMDSKKSDIKMWLEYRTVCKSWYSIVCAFPRICLLNRSINSLRVLEIFSNVHHLRLHPNFQIDLSLCRNLMTLSFESFTAADANAVGDGEKIKLINQWKSLGSLTKLTTLELGNNPYISNECVTLLTNLTKLNLQQNSDIKGETIRTLRLLKSLDLSYTDGQFTDDDISMLTNLTRLTVYNTPDITYEGIQNLKNLICLESTNPDHFKNRCKGTFNQPDLKKKYIGDMFESKRDGYGILIWRNSIGYEGSWKNNRICGPGHFCLINDNK